jgi:hypothetical protein
MSDPSDFGLLLPFDTDEPEFCRGFEAGRLWALLGSEPHEEIEEYAHATNAEMLIRMGEATGRVVTAELMADDCWVFVKFEPAGVEV